MRVTMRLLEAIHQIEFIHRRVICGALLLACLMSFGCRTFEPRGMDLHLDQGRCLASVKIGDQILSAMVDTGATHSVIDLKIAESLGLKTLENSVEMEVSGIGEYSGRLATVGVDEIELGGMVFQNWILVGVEFQKAPVWSRDEVSMIIGMDILQSAKATLDLGRGRLTFASPFRVLKLEETELISPKMN